MPAECIFCAIVRGEAPATFLHQGKTAGHEVAHVHIHLIPRRAEDGFGFRFPPGYGTHPPRTELDRIAGEIRPGILPTGAPGGSGG